MSDNKIYLPEPFGEGDFRLSVVELCAAANGWDAGARLLRLPTLLRGRSFAAFEMLTLPEDDLKDYEAVKEALKCKLDPDTDEQRRLARSRLLERKLTPGEDTDSFLWDLTRQVFPMPGGSGART